MARSHREPRDLRTILQDVLPKLVLSPSLAAMLICVYGFIIYTVFLSFTNSKMLPSYDFVGWDNYVRLFNLPAWSTALVNLAIFASLYIEPLRTLRLVHYSAWLAQRWQDPAFPRAFPWFGTEAYWLEQTTILQSQVLAMQEPPLAI